MSIKTFADGIQLTPTEGGKEAIERICEAYGFGKRQQLADHMGVSKGGMGNRWMRDTFPYDWIIVCAAETKASLSWLMTGKGPMFTPQESDLISVNNIKIVNGLVEDAKFSLFDTSFLRSDIKEPVQLIEHQARYILESKFNDITDGLWLVEIEGTNSLRKLSRLPNKKLRVSDDEISFECNIDDIKPIGKVIMTTLYS
ncbi:phage repressor protein CI [Erwinia billingiae]|uniref:phage repressor protein CI n=1 Tax=Erwinia billingiae TaxID=182337 RepID=UPI0030CCC31D